MNERIKELWAQAGGRYDVGNQHDWPQYTIDDPEKFAKLIVRECANVAAEQSAYNPEYRIRKHFGVEE